MFTPELIAHADRLIAALRTRGWMLATAESCTGGLIAALVTEIAGASDVFERGFVTYSNAAKIGCLGVDYDLLRRHGAVSREVALAMAAGARRASAADIAVAVTGVAGPGGGTPEKPVGLVHIGLAALGKPAASREFHFGDPGRSAIRLATVSEALKMIDEALAA
ncbi:MAG: CinA family protein [Hyphomicrobium sp.]|uniref:CinA family protein n=1 Tax=Hyphomicrobium sp. TaxID=82 RepID=UPI003D0D67F0